MLLSHFLRISRAPSLSAASSRKFLRESLSESRSCPNARQTRFRTYAATHIISAPPLSEAQQHTIYALSTPVGKAGVAVLRISGPGASDVWKNMVKLPASTRTRLKDGLSEAAKMERCLITNPTSGETIDDGLAVYFHAPKSFTTEDVLELHVHSGRAIISSILSALSQLPFCRHAEPGEFTRRAFEGGRLDLTQAEGLKDLIEADTEQQRRVALRAAVGDTRARFEDLRGSLIRCLAMVEALIDFGEGEDIEEGVLDQAREQASAIKAEIQKHLSDGRRGEIIRAGIRLVIFGPPNAGKSSLLNFLAQREAAIVTHVPGTTRDILELSLDIGGLPTIVADTAGLRHTIDMVESIGVERAVNAVKAADVRLCVLSLPELTREAGGANHFQTPDSVKSLVTSDTLFLLNKVDLLSAPPSLPIVDKDTGSRSWCVSLTNSEGTEDFLKGLAVALRERCEIQDNNEQTPLITNARHRVHLASALRFIEAFLSTSAEDIVPAAEELRYAAQAIGKISGLIDVEDVLDAIFRDFCIGK